MKTDIIRHINSNTNPEMLEELSTKEIAAAFGISSKKAYTILSECANENLIKKLDPVNGGNFECCGWIKNNDKY